MRPLCELVDRSEHLSFHDCPRCKQSLGGWQLFRRLVTSPARSSDLASRAKREEMSTTSASRTVVESARTSSREGREIRREIQTCWRLLLLQKESPSSCTCHNSIRPPKFANQTDPEDFDRIH